MKDSSSLWFTFSTKLRFFTKVRRFLQSNTSRKYYGQSDKFEIKEESIEEKTEMEIEIKEDLFLMQRSVKKFNFGSWEEKEVAAKEIKKLASEDVKTRKYLAALGVVPSLVSMINSEILDRRRLAVQCLIELANGTYTNKALVVDAGILSKLPRTIDEVDKSSRHDFALLLLSISSLANTQFQIDSSKILPFLVGILDSDSNIKTKTTCLEALYNLSTMLDNVGPLVSNGVVHILLRLLSEKETSEKALATLGNLVVSVMGKKAMENDPTMPEILIEIMTWEAKPKCQELSAYIFMILAHQSSAQREKMKQLGIVPILLEVALLGSPLARKRVLKLLQWFKNEKQIKIRSHSGPQTGIAAMGSPVNEMEINEGKKIIKMMVKQSLDKNMELITRRANSAGDSSDSSKIKALVISSRSKSFPY